MVIYRFEGLDYYAEIIHEQKTLGTLLVVAGIRNSYSRTIDDSSAPNLCWSLEVPLFSSNKRFLAM